MAILFPEQMPFDPALLLQFVNDAVIVVDADWRIRYWNLAAVDTYGWQPADVLGQEIAAIIPSIDYLGGASAEAAREALLQSASWRGMVVQRHRDGHALIIDASVRAVQDAQGATVAFIAINREVTARVRLEEERARLLAEAQRARAEAERAASRMARLQEVTAMLAEPRPPDEMVALILAQLIPASAARAAAVFGYAAATCQLTLLATHGFSPAHVARLQTMSINTASVFTDALRSGAAVFVEAAAARDARYPQLAQLRQSEDQAAAALPLIVDGQTIGCVGLTFTEAQRFAPEQRAFLAALAQQCAMALQRAQLSAAAQAATHTKDETLAVLDTFFASAPIGLAFLDTELRYQRINQMLAELNGISVAAHLGRTPAELLPDLAPTVEPLLRQVLASGVALRDLEIHGTTPAAPQVARVWLASYYPVCDSQRAIVGIGIVVLEITEQRRADVELRASAQQLQDLSRRLVDTQEAERRHIARELHDEIGQVLTGLKLSLDLLARRASDALAAEIDPLRADIGALIERVRALSLDLRPMMLDDLGLLPALQWHISRYTSQTQVRVDLRHNGIDRRFSQQVETTVYRVVQEALTNVARYAQARVATVRLLANEERLMVRIDDEGAGFMVDAALAARTTGGLWGMIERVRLLNGELVIESAPGQGTHVIAELPLQASGVAGERRAL